MKSIDYKDLPELFPRRTDLKPIRRIWKGQDVYIIGGGPGFRHVDESKLVDKHVIGCNDACRLAPGVTDICYFLDESWWEGYKLNPCNEFTGRFVTINRMVQEPEVTVHESVKRGCYTGKGSKIASNANTGLSAINLAYKMGAKRIILLGFDMNHDVDGKHHWHDYNERAPSDGLMRNRRGLAYEIYEDLRNEDVELINATPGSLIPFWPIVQPKEVGL